MLASPSPTRDARTALAGSPPAGAGEQRAGNGRAALRAILAVDGATCVAMGASLVVAAAALAPWLGLPEPLLWWAGLVLFPSAALMLGAAAARRPPPWLVRIVVAGNAAWVLASLFVAFGPFEPTAPGRALVLVQAAVVAVLMVLEWRRLRGAG